MNSLHSLGKGEAESSILSGGTIFSRKKQKFCLFFPQKSKILPAFQDVCVYARAAWGASRKPSITANALAQESAAAGSFQDLALDGAL